MSSGGVTVTVFGRTAQAREFAQLVGARYINPTSFDVQQLKLVARHGVVEPYCVVVERSGTTVARIPRLPEFSELMRVVQRCYYGTG